MCKAFQHISIQSKKYIVQVLPFIILSDIGVWPNFESGDIFVLVEDMNVVVRWNPEQGLTRLWFRRHCGWLIFLSEKHKREILTKALL